VLLLTEKNQKVLVMFSAIISILVILGFLSLAVFTKSTVVYYFGLRLILGTSIATLIYSFFFTNVYNSKPRLAINILAILNSTFFFVLADFFGGPVTNYFYLVYILLIISYFIDEYFGFITSGLTILYIVVAFFIHQGTLTTYFAPLNSAIFISILCYLIAKEYRKTLDEKHALEQTNSALTSDQSKEDALLSSIADGVYVVDMNRNVTKFNAAAEDMTGWTAKEAVGLKCWTIMNLKNDQDVSICQKDCPALAVWNSGSNVMRDDTCFTKHRGKKSVQISSSYAPIKDSQGRLTGAICVFRDITQQKEVERLRNEFVSTASHELRTPITAMEGYMELIENDKICKIDDKAKEYVGKARNTATGMSNLVKNLLSVTKIEEGKIQTNITKFSIHDLASETVEAMQLAAQNKNLTLKLVEAPNQSVKGEKAVGRSLNVVADRDQIKEVLFNLIENGLKFTTEGGVSIWINYDTDFATVCVADTGMGIPADGQKHIFEKFYRYDNSATREVGGTGLGLFITRSIVEMFGGKIWLESQANKGTKFYFTIPRSLD
jgi:PAS domain S-box-containing protein